VGQDQLAVLEGGRLIEGAAYTVLVIDPATFDPEAKLVSGGLANVAIDLPQATPADLFTVSASIAGEPGAGAMVVVNAGDLVYPGQILQQNAYFEALPIGGPASGLQTLGIPGDTWGAVAFAAPSGFHLEWLTGYDASGFIRWQEDFTAAGVAIGSTLTQTQGAALIPYAGLTLHGAAFTIEDNVAQLAGAAAVGVPGEPAHAMTEVAAAALADGVHAAVGWVDSGTDYVSLFDSATDSFGPAIGLDWGGAGDIHLVALPDGGFVASWMNGGAYRGEVFAADGTGGGIIPLAGDVEGITSSGDLYTLDHGFYGQQYQIDPGQVVSTGAATYAAPESVRTVFLTGSNQTVTANGAGDVIWSNNTGNAVMGGSGDDTFYIGRGGDWVAGGGGDDVFKFAEVPWAGAHITDFQAGDSIDLTLMLATLYPVGDPFAAGYMKLTDDGAGDAQLWADYHLQGNDGWWLVATVQGVSPSGLHYANGMMF
jgi:Ca2+-binding RTX toxin-like protein